jgi:hypothetical protein
MMRSRLVLVLSIVCGCGGGSEARAPAATSKDASPPPPAPVGDALAAEKPPEPLKQRKPFDLYNACTEVVTVVLGDDPKAEGAGRRTVAPTSSIDLPRDPEGNQRLWLLDGKGEPLFDVRVSRGMKRVEIGRSCRTMDAR